MNQLRRMALWWRNRPMRARLVSILVLAMVGSLAAMTIVIGLVANRVLMVQLDTELRVQVLRAPTFFSNLDQAETYIAPDQVTVLYRDDGRRYIIAPAKTKSNVFPASLTFQEATATNLQPWTIGSWRVIALPVEAIADASDDESPGSILIARPLDVAHSPLQRILMLFVLLGILVTAFTAYLGASLLRLTFRPLVELESTATAIASGQWGSRAPEAPASTEIGRLTLAFNTMLTRIEEALAVRESAIKRTRQFAADASHELRTPLSSIQGFAELYRVGAVPPDEVPRTFERIESEAKRMNGLVEDLLTLARLDASRPLREQAVNILLVARDALYDSYAHDHTRAVSLVNMATETAFPEDMSEEALARYEVCADDQHIRQVFGNLLSNALRYTPDGTPIELAVGLGEDTDGPGALPNHVILEVRDHGQGLPSDDRGKVFERFFRHDSSRNRGTGGSGLGLSISAAIVHAHGGVIAHRPTPGGGATFRVSLPTGRPDRVNPTA